MLVIFFHNSLVDGVKNKNLMVAPLRGITKMVKRMDKGNILLLMEVIMKENFQEV